MDQMDKKTIMLLFLIFYLLCLFFLNAHSPAKYAQPLLANTVRSLVTVALAAQCAPRRMHRSHHGGSARVHPSHAVAPQWLRYMRPSSHDHVRSRSLTGRTP